MSLLQNNDLVRPSEASSSLVVVVAVAVAVVAVVVVIVVVEEKYVGAHRRSEGFVRGFFVPVASCLSTASSSSSESNQARRRECRYALMHAGMHARVLRAAQPSSPSS